MERKSGENGTGLNVGLAVALVLAVASVGSLGILHNLLHRHSAGMRQSMAQSAQAQTVSVLPTR